MVKQKLVSLCTFALLFIVKPSIYCQAAKTLQRLAIHLLFCMLQYHNEFKGKNRGMSLLLRFVTSNFGLKS